MAKGYWIARIKINDPDRYQDYVKANAEAFAKYGARFIVRGGTAETRSGPTHDRHVVLEFDSFDTAKACHDSPEYQRAKAIRDEAADVDMVIIEGYDG